MSGLLPGFTINGGSTVGRSFYSATTDGMIQDDAGHWSIEPYIPLKAGVLAKYLLERGELPEERYPEFRQRCEAIDRFVHQQTGDYHRDFASHYAPVDPDSDCKPLCVDLSAETKQDSPETSQSHQGAFNAASQADETPRQVSEEAGPSETQNAMNHVFELLGKVMHDAGYRKIEQQEIEKCMGIASQWGVPLNVDLGVFEKLVVYARGDIMGTRFRRRLRKFYRMESFEIPVYQRMTIAFQLKSDLQGTESLGINQMHLRMFKNISKEDVDTLLPGARVRISGLDHVKIIVPSLGGFLMSLRKIAQYAILFAVIALHWSLILIGLLVGYLVKSTLGYFDAKKKRELKLTRNLYFQKLDTNAGVGHRLIQQAHRQHTCELIVASYALLTASDTLSSRRLRRRCERILREAIDVEIDFQTDRVMDSLQKMNSVVHDSQGWCLKPIEFTE